jgi:hypothetical protein
MVKIMLLEIMLEILVPTLWACLAVYTAWYFTSAKHYAPITRKEARTLWHIHKHNAECSGKKCTEIRRRGKIIGFECECGYKHVQKRPLIIPTPTHNIKLPDSEYSTVDNVRTGYKSK